MSDLSSIGRLIVVLGVVLVALGLVFTVLGRVPFLRDLGHMPGDIHIEGRNFTCFAPIVSMIIISVLLTIVLNVILRLLSR
ncbi:MAG TPA: DUF2905 domain-containing protein [Aggregatilinea sp.]|uniref:DUF2905 domain-containing protein n=1 Tax=Aggregatilinea sp. TaxID=2806333 RepID=UPI002B74FC24|nr:DUF2905 domain-containing protein [Aggregatilinea sp.]HML24372.1 DUF2905 domain-containing protein [Aggregatilinea sp.]